MTRPIELWYWPMPNGWKISVGKLKPKANESPTRLLLTHVGLWERPLTASNYGSEDRTFQSFRARRKSGRFDSNRPHQ